MDIFWIVWLLGMPISSVGTIGLFFAHFTGEYPSLAEKGYKADRRGAFQQGLVSFLGSWVTLVVNMFLLGGHGWVWPNEEHSKRLTEEYYS